VVDPVPFCADTVGARGQHTCARSDDGQIACWGRNHHGQLGIGSTAYTSSAVIVELPDGAAADTIVTGTAHTCALAGGNVFCWGYNADGAVGIGDTEDRLDPQRADIGDVEVLVSGGFHVCAIRSDRTLWCWGDNVAGQIGAGGDVTTPRQIASNVDAVALGEEHTCIAQNGAVSCWGRNIEGQLGDGTTTSRSSPAPVRLAAGGQLTGITAISAGVYHTCAQDGGGDLVCWGSNVSGQMGTGTQGADALNPTAVQASFSAAQVGGGEFHSCARDTGGNVYCWGGNSSGQLGTGDSSDRMTPARVQSISGASDLSVGDLHTCTTVSGDVLCWGYNASGQLGDGSTDGSSSPVTGVLVCD
jgi:alpha-tubulin suppressor-like RCC1 family protein